MLCFQSFLALGLGMHVRHSIQRNIIGNCFIKRLQTFFILVTF